MRVIGYKWVCVEAPIPRYGSLSLMSAFDAHVWTRGPNRASYPPSPDTMWGFNAYHGALRARWSGRRFGNVMVGLAGFGTVALFEHGWRAEKAEIVAIHVPRGVWRGYGAEARAALRMRLHATYDVPVFRSLRALRRETERWGQPGSAFLRVSDPASPPPPG